MLGCKGLETEDDIAEMITSGFEKSYIFKCVIDVTPKFLRSPRPVKRSITKLVKQWMQANDINSDFTNDSFNVDTLILHTLKHVSQLPLRLLEPGA